MKIHAKDIINYVVRNIKISLSDFYFFHVMRVSDKFNEYDLQKIVNPERFAPNRDKILNFIRDYTEVEERLLNETIQEEMFRARNYRFPIFKWWMKLRINIIEQKKLDQWYEIWSDEWDKSHKNNKKIS